MSARVNLFTSRCLYQLRRIKSCRRALPQEAAKTLVNNFTGLQRSTTSYLDSALYAATHMVSGRRKYDHITLVLRDELHWLPVHSEWSLSFVWQLIKLLTASRLATLQHRAWLPCSNVRANIDKPWLAYISSPPSPVKLFFHWWKLNSESESSRVSRYSSVCVMAVTSASQYPYFSSCESYCEAPYVFCRHIQLHQAPLEVLTQPPNDFLISAPRSITDIAYTGLVVVIIDVCTSYCVWHGVHRPRGCNYGCVYVLLCLTWRTPALWL